MNYRLKFLPTALKEFNNLDNSIRMQLSKALKKRLENPIIPKDRLRNFTKKECYKIKLRTLGIRLVYAVENDQLILVVIAVGKRENNEVYDLAIERSSDL